MDAILKVQGIDKKFDTVHALKGVNISFYQGEIHGLIGENGSGKSTLSSIISGIYPATEGRMFLEGKEYKPTSILDGEKHGVKMIVQEMGTINGITIAANIFAGKEHLFSKYGLVNRKKMIKEAQNALDNIGASDIRADKLSDEESFENRKIVEIARAMYSETKVLIVDETTTALSQKGRSVIYQLMNQLKQNGSAVIFISHDLDELKQHCDTVSILRDGEYITTLRKNEIEPEYMRELMVGRKVNDEYYRTDYGEDCSGEPILNIRGLSGKGLLQDVSFSLKKGEILGIGGLTDSGMHDVGRYIFGIEVPSAGTIEYAKTGEKICSPGDAIRYKIGYVSKNRDKESILNNSNICDNICLPSLDKIRNGVHISPKAEKKLANEGTSRLSIKMSSLHQLCGQLSGGNKQKVALAKWLGNDSEILILDCPTRGIDVGVKAAIYKWMNEYRKEGNSIIMISEELPELIGMSDRIIIIKDGVLKHEFTRSESLTETDVIQYML